MTDATGASVVPDLDALTSWHAPWAGLEIVVVGLGTVGFSAADTLAELGARVTVVAERGHEEHERILAVLGVPVVIADAAGVAAEIDRIGPVVVVPSPGVPESHPAIEAARRVGAAVWSDLELAWRLRDKVPSPTTGAPAEWIMITGTNGKTTTTQLTEAMLLAGGRRAIACGNIGLSALDAIRAPDGWDVLVVECSSFQLARTSSTSPLASVCLNLADDHLDWHGGATGYRDAKARVYESARVACVYNRQDEATMRMVEDADVVEGCRAIGFGLGAPGPSDVGLVEGILVDRAFLEERRTHALEVTTLDRLAAAGLAAPHVVANVLAATALARAAGVEPESIRDALDAFRLGGHRIAEVAILDGIRFVDDSKATNAHAAAASLSAFDSVVWVVGGLLKGAVLDDLVAAHAGRLRAAVVIGTSRQAVLSAFARHAPEVTVLEVDAAEDEDVMTLAVDAAASVAQSGDTVLLAPAAASMDQFTDYAERGRRFVEAVESRRKGAGDEHDAAPGRPVGGADAVGGSEPDGDTAR